MELMVYSHLWRQARKEHKKIVIQKRRQNKLIARPHQPKYSGADVAPGSCP
jgi:hypothetical protein